MERNSNFLYEKMESKVDVSFAEKERACRELSSSISKVVCLRRPENLISI